MSRFYLNGCCPPMPVAGRPGPQATAGFTVPSRQRAFDGLGATLSMSPAATLSAQLSPTTSNFGTSNLLTASKPPATSSGLTFDQADKLCKSRAKSGKTEYGACMVSFGHKPAASNTFVPKPPKPSVDTTGPLVPGSGGGNPFTPGGGGNVPTPGVDPNAFRETVYDPGAEGGTSPLVYAAVALVGVLAFLKFRKKS